MTPEERKGALVGLLGRLRTNAGARLPKRSGDEEEFVPKSVIAARAAAAQNAEAQTVADLERPRFAPDDVALDTDPPPTAIPGSSPGTLEEALQQAEQVELDRIAAEAAVRADAPHEESAPPTPRGEGVEEAPSIEMGDSAELELDLLDPFDDLTATGEPEEIEALALESEPPPGPPRVAAQPPPRPAPTAPAASPAPPAPPASLTRAIPLRASPTIESRAVVPPPAPAPPPPGAAKLRPPSPSQPDDKLAPPPPRPPAPRPPAPSSPGSSPRAAAPPPAAPAPSPSAPEVEPTPRPAERAVHPPPISRVEPISSKPGSIELPFDERTEERSDVTASAPADDVLIRDELEEEDDDDELSRTVNMPKRVVDPLAQTAQNPIPAAFERAVLRAEGTHVPSSDAPPPPFASSTAEPAAENPVSSKQPRALDREGGEIDEALRVGDADDVDDAPQSGEIASQRQPSTGPHRGDLDLDGATPPSDQADAVANEAMALLEAEAVPSAPPATRPAVMGRRPVAVTSFLDVLDDALSLGE